MAEKRKKAEAAKLGRDSAKANVSSPRDVRRAAHQASSQATSGNQRSSGDAATPTNDRSPAAGGASSRLEELRRKRIEVLRSRMGVDSAAASSVTPPPAPAAVPPIVVSIATPPTRTSGTPRQREASGSSGSSRSSRSSRSSNSRSPESNSATSSRSRSQSRKPVSERGSVADRVSRSKAIKGGAKLKSAAKTITPVSSSGMARSASGDSGSAGRTAASLASRLRNRGRFRQAILMAELLQPPVGLRPPTSGDHHE